MASQASDLFGDFLIPENVGGLDSDFLVGGGIDQANLLLDAFSVTEEGARGRAAGGLDLLRELIGLQRDPGNITAQLQAMALAGGNAATAAQAKGGQQTPGVESLLQQLLGGLGEFALGEGNVQTGGGGAQATQNQIAAQTASGGTTKAAASGAGAVQLDASKDGGTTTVPSTDREGLPSNVVAAIRQFEAGQGNVGVIGKAVKDSEIQALSERNIAKRAFETTPDTVLPKTKGQRLFDKTTIEGGSTLKSPQLIEATIRNAISKRQTKQGARNQVLSSVVGRAGAGAS